MFGLPIRSVADPRKLVVAPPQTTVTEAAKLLKEAKVGAVLVVEEGRLVGIFTERDVVFRVIAAGRDAPCRRDDARPENRRAGRDVRLRAAAHARERFPARAGGRGRPPDRRR